MLAAISKIFLLLGSFMMISAAMYPVYVIAIYIVVRPILQPFAFMQLKVFSLPISFPFALIIITFGVIYTIIKPNWNVLAKKSKYFLFFLLIAILTSTLSVNYIDSLTGLVKILTAWFIFNIAYNSINKTKDVDVLLISLVISSFVPMLFGFYQAFTGNYDIFYDAAVDRVSSVFGVGNAYGIFLSIITAATTILLLRQKNKKYQVILVLILAGIVISQVLSLNRGTWLALTFGFFIAAFRYRQYISFKWISVFILLIIIFFSKIIINRFYELETRVRWTGENTLEGRVDYWTELMPLIAKRSLTGYGVGTTKKVAEKYLKIGGMPHNDFVRLALETGLLGAFFYFMFLLSICIYFYTRSLTSDLWKYNFALLMLSLYFIIISMTQNIIYSQINFPAFLVMVAIGIKMNVMYKTLKTRNSVDETTNKSGFSGKQRILKYKRNE